MSWKTIRTALKARLQAVSTAAGALPQPLPTFQCHDSFRWASDGPDGDRFQALFVSGGRLSVARMTRTGRQLQRTDGTRKKIHHQVLIELNLALNDQVESELLHQDLVDLLCDNLRDGDHTLGGVAKTHGDPDVTNIQDGNFAGALCHTCEIRFTVEELVA